MPYTHIVIASPALTADHLQERPGWNQFHLEGEIHTQQASTLVFTSEQPIDMVLSSDLLAQAPEPVPVSSRTRWPRQPVGEARYQQVLALQKAGVSTGTIAKRLGVGKRAIQRWLA